jgi:hypothetical protein
MKYGRTRYSKGKYGRYELPTDQGGALGQDVKYRIRSIGPNKIKSQVITNMAIEFPTVFKPSAVRVRSNISQFVTQQNAAIDGNPYKIRVKAVANGTDSSWVESVVGTVKLKGV